LNKIHILMLKEKDSLYKIIGKIAGEEYYHVAMTTDQNLENMITFRDTVRREKISKINPRKECKLIELEVTDEELNKLNDSIEYYLQHRKDYKFNLLGTVIMCFVAIPLFDRGLHFVAYPMIKLMGRRNRFICATFIMNLFYENDIRLLDHLNDPKFGPSYSHWLMSPYAYDRIGLKEVYTGTIEGLKKAYPAIIKEWKEA